MRYDRLVRMLERGQLLPPPGAMSDQRAHFASAAIVDAASLEVPAPQLDRVAHAEVDALERVARHGEFDDPRPAVGGGDAFTIRFARKEPRAPDVGEIHVVPGVDGARPIDRSGCTGRTRLVGRQPTLHLRVDAREARGLRLACGPARFEPGVGELVDVVVARIPRWRVIGRLQHGHAHRVASRPGDDVTRRFGIAVEAHPRAAVGGRTEPGLHCGERRASRERHDQDDVAGSHSACARCA
jgi:hypothetical protein